MSSQRIKTSCVGLCPTVCGDLVCRGCKCLHHEVVNWSLYDAEEKWVVWSRPEQLLAQVMVAKLEIFDVACLRLQLEQRQIHFVPEQSPYCQAYQLIVRGSRPISQIEACGVTLLPEFRDWSLPDLRDAIDREFSPLLEAHCQRYIVLPFLQAIDRQVVSPAKRPPSGGFFVRPAVTPCRPTPPDGQ